MFLYFFIIFKIFINILNILYYLFTFQNLQKKYEGRCRAKSSRWMDYTRRGRKNAAKAAPNINSKAVEGSGVVIISPTLSKVPVS